MFITNINIEKVEPLSTITLNASRSYNLLYFIYARKASQMVLRNLRKIYATVEIHLQESAAHGFAVLRAAEMTSSGQNGDNIKYKRKWLKIKRRQ